MSKSPSRDGVTVSRAAGRILKAAKPFISQLYITVPEILYNGTVAIDPVEGEVVWSEKISPDKARISLRS